MGWLDGYDDDAGDDDRDPGAVAEPAEAPAAPAVVILTCKHCGSDRIGPRSSSTDSTQIVFACAACGRRTTHSLPYGYRRVYCANIDAGKTS